MKLGVIHVTFDGTSFQDKTFAEGKLYICIVNYDSASAIETTRRFSSLLEIGQAKKTAALGSM
jgi:hypothetical protein